MKIYLRGYFGVLSIFTVLVCLLIYIFGFKDQKNLFLFQSYEEHEIQSFLKDFKKSHEPIGEINLAEMYGQIGQRELLHPIFNSKMFYLVQCENCANPQLRFDEDIQAHDLKVNKRKTLGDVLYNSKPLPVDFFNKPPFVDQNGMSFAYLISIYGGISARDKKWVEQHLSFFRASELSEVLKKYQINEPSFSILSKLNENEIESVVKGENFVLTNDYVLFRNQSRLGFSPLSYWVYNIKDFVSSLKLGKYDVSQVQSNIRCLSTIGNSCWSYNSQQTQSYLYKYSKILIFCFGLMIFIFLVFQAKSIYEKNKAELKHQLTLQVLSHEFRTPVSSMMLMLEDLRQRSQHWRVEDQDILIRMSSENYQLQRIIEVSKTYLQTKNHRIHFKKVEISSVNSWISDFISESKLPIRYDFLKEDQKIIMDPFWLKFILSNLVQNAFLHGKPPVFIKINIQKNRLSIAVEDQGICEFDHFKQMTETFVKNSQSQGMGLGLGMVQSIVRELGGKMTFTQKPTTFTLVLPQPEVKK